MMEAYLLWWKGEELNYDSVMGVYSLPGHVLIALRTLYEVSEEHMKEYEANIFTCGDHLDFYITGVPLDDF